MPKVSHFHCFSKRKKGLVNFIHLSPLMSRNPCIYHHSWLDGVLNDRTLRVSEIEEENKNLAFEPEPIPPSPLSKSLSKVDENSFSEKYILEIFYNTSKHTIPMISNDLETIWELVPHNFDFMVSGDSCIA